MMRSTLLVAVLVCVAAPALLAQYLDGTSARRHDGTMTFVRRADVATWRRAAPHYGKWLTAAGSATFTVLGAEQHRLSRRVWDRLLDVCRSAQGACDVGADGRYLRADAESLYQSSRTYDRRANRWLLGAQAARAGGEPHRHGRAVHHRPASRRRTGQHSVRAGACRARGASRRRAGGDARPLLADSEQLEASLIPRDDTLAIGRVLAALERGVGRDHRRRGAARGFQQRHIGLEVRVPQRHTARLLRARQLAHAPLAQVELGDLEAVARFAERLQPRRRVG